MNQAFGGAVGGAASGAAIGTQILPGWGTAIGGIAGGLLGFLGGSVGDDTAEYNANMQHYNALVQAGAYRAAAEFNAQQMMAAASANAAISGQVAGFNQESVQQTARYNSALSRLLANYNAGRMEDQAIRNINEGELNAKLLDRQVVKVMGDQRAYFANAGVQVNRQGDTPQRVAISTRVQGDLDIALIRHQADLVAADLQNDAAATRVMGDISAMQAEWEGLTQASMIASQNALNTSGMMINAYTQAQAAQYQGTLAAYQAINQGSMNANAIGYQNQQMGWANMYSGIGQAAGIGVTGYMNNLPGGTEPLGSVGQNTTAIGHPR